MFAPLGLFKSVRCPKIYDCAIPQCLFDHEELHRTHAQGRVAEAEAYDPASAGTSDSPPSKRRRTNVPGTIEEASDKSSKDEYQLSATRFEDEDEGHGAGAATTSHHKTPRNAVQGTATSDADVGAFQSPPQHMLGAPDGVKRTADRLSCASESTESTTRDSELNSNIQQTHLASHLPKDPRLRRKMMRISDQTDSLASAASLAIQHDQAAAGRSSPATNSLTEPKDLPAIKHATQLLESSQPRNDKGTKPLVLTDRNSHKGFTSNIRHPGDENGAIHGTLLAPGPGTTPGSHTAPKAQKGPQSVLLMNKNELLQPEKSFENSHIACSPSSSRDYRGSSSHLYASQQTNTASATRLTQARSQTPRSTASARSTEISYTPNTVLKRAVPGGNETRPTKKLKPIVVEELKPRPVSKEPVSWAVRLKVIQKMHDKMLQMNSKAKEFITCTSSNVISRQLALCEELEERYPGTPSSWLLAAGTSYGAQFAPTDLGESTSDYSQDDDHYLHISLENDAGFYDDSGLYYPPGSPDRPRTISRPTVFDQPTGHAPFELTPSSGYVALAQDHTQSSQQLSADNLMASFFDEQGQHHISVIANGTTNYYPLAPEVNPFILQAMITEQNIVRWVLDHEQYAAANLSADVYRSTMGQRIKRFDSMKEETYISEVFDKFEYRMPEKPAPSPTKPADGSDPVKFETGLSSVEDEVKVLRHLKANLGSIEQFGYVVRPHTEQELAQTRANNKDHNWETCARCETRFQVFPGRNDLGQLTTGGICTHHWGRLFNPGYKTTDRVTGQTERYYACCNKPQGSEGCTTSSTHVFKVQDPKRLGVQMAFKETPKNLHSQSCPAAVAFDCEMAYTSLGMEMIRLTAISWPDNKLLIDTLVRPIGEILDFNTRFSGISPDQYADAEEFDYQTDNETRTLSSPSLSKARPTQDGLLHRAQSPAAARALLFHYLTPDTPLIGHGIENDLNVARIVHPVIVDTVLLYPCRGGLPYRHKLQDLAQQYLGRSIQVAGQHGHDSMEDALATADLVKVKVTEAAKRLRMI